MNTPPAERPAGGRRRGPTTRALVALAVPSVARNAVRVAKRVIDTFWLGRFGETVVAAVGVTVPILGVLFALLTTPFVGTRIPVSQRVGGYYATAVRGGLFADGPAVGADPTD